MSRTPSIRPGRGDITTTRSDRRTASGIECVMNTTVLRAPARALEVEPHLLARERVERPERLVHEEQRRVVDQGPAIATRWRMPPDSSNGYRSSKPSRPTPAGDRGPSRGAPRGPAHAPRPGAGRSR